MSRAHNTIIILFCLIILGFFANFAHNDYGLQLVSVTLFAITGICFYLAIQKIKKYKALGFFLLSDILFLQIVSIQFKEDWIIAAYMLPVLFMLIIYPIWIKIAERKKPASEVMQYYEWFCTGLLCLGNFMKHFHMAGAGPVLVLSGFLIVPIIYDVFNKKKKYYQTFSARYDLVKNMMISFSLVGMIFKTQHWPGANSLLLTGTVLFILCMFCLIVLIIRNDKVNINSVFFVRNISFYSLSVLLLFYELRMLDLVPKIYSSELPQAMYILEAKKGDFSVEERKIQKQYVIYRDNYFEFLSNQELEVK